jgi:hypothetical protein
MCESEKKEGNDGFGGSARSEVVRAVRGIHATSDAGAGGEPDDGADAWPAAGIFV